MKKTRKSLAVIIATVLCLTAIIGFATTAMASEPVTGVFVETTGGTVMGYRYDGVDTFFDIKYGEAERFQPAVAATWEGTRCCNVMGEVCPQTGHDTASRDLFNSFPYNLLQVESEAECLNLNVWSQGAGTEGTRPVIVWLHGGGYSTGSSTQFNFYLGESMAQAYDVVFVSVNHRLNCLGYMDLSAYGEEYKYSGNVGQMDIQLALQWVQDNIELFGGDPSNVTIIGQSGGGSKVTTLMSTPSAKGLFQKAVALSGGAVAVTRTTEDAQAETAAVVEILGLEGSDAEIAQQLVELPYEELLAAATEAGVSYGPVVDGDYIPTGTYEISADIPFIASNVMGEFSTNYAAVVPYAANEYVHNMLAYMTDEEAVAQYESTYEEGYAEKIMEAFQEAYPTHPLKDGLYLNNRYGSFSALPLLDAMASYGGTCYNSLVAYDYAMYNGIVPIHTASSIPFWFNNVDDIPEFVAGDEEGAEAVAKAMSGALAAFAYTGDPSTEELPWEAYTPENGATMVFDTVSEVKEGFFDKELFELIEEGTPASSGSEAADTEAAEEAPAEEVNEDSYKAFLKEACTHISAIADNIEEFYAAIDAGNYVDFPADMLFVDTYFGYALPSLEEYLAAGGNVEIPDYDPTLSADAEE